MSVKKKTQAAAKPAPRKRNKRPKRERNERFMPVYSRDKVLPINTRNDREMVAEGLRLPLLSINPEWHKKDPEERAKLSKVSKIKNLRASHHPLKEDTMKRKLIVYLKNPSKKPVFKTTYSEMIEKHKVNGYLEMCFGKVKDQINKIYYNGKIYKW